MSKHDEHKNKPLDDMFVNLAHLPEEVNPAMGKHYLETVYEQATYKTHHVVLLSPENVNSFKEYALKVIKNEIK